MQAPADFSAADDDATSVGEERSRDRFACVVLALILGICALGLWLNGSTDREAAARLAIAGVCTATTTSNCRAPAPATVVDRSVDGTGAVRLVLNPGTVAVVLDAAASGEPSPNRGDQVVAVTFEGQVVELDTAAGAALQTQRSPAVGVDSNRVLVAVALAALVVTVLVGAVPRQAPPIVRRALGRTRRQRHDGADVPPTPAAGADPIVTSPQTPGSHSFATAEPARPISDQVG